MGVLARSLALAILALAALSTAAPAPAAATPTPALQRRDPASVSAFFSASSNSSAATSTISCIRTWCLDETAEMCLYNAGVTGWESGRGPVPGIVATSLGPCTPAPTPELVIVTVTTTTTDWVTVA